MKKGVSLVEYILILLMAGLVLGGILSLIDPTDFKNILKGSIGATEATTNNSIIKVGPITD